VPGPRATDRDDPRVDVASVFRSESGPAVATVARLTGDIGLAEDAVQEAFAIALQRWPRDGVPARPGAWITTTARNRALDVLRRESTRPDRERRATREAVVALEATPPILHPVVDDQLRLVFTCCHPGLPRDARVELTLRLVCGLSVAEIARALLRGEEAVGKRIQRAKAKIRDAGIPLRVPPPELLEERLPSVLDCTYLTFSEGYASTAGDDLIRRDLCDEGIRLTRLVVDLLPDHPGAEALLALMLLQDSRRDARLDADGRIVLLADQDRSQWDQQRIAEGRRWLARALAHPTLTTGAAAYLLQAAIADEHARAPAWEVTDWSAIVRHYDQLVVLTPSPSVALNRAVAVSFADGPAVALPLLDELAADPRLARSHRLALARADVAARAGALDTARTHLATALSLAPTAPEQAHVRRRLDALGS
jgi:RNA polymerase sigma-70 factor (ECF subfamily)